MSLAQLWLPSDLLQSWETFMVPPHPSNGAEGLPYMKGSAGEDLSTLLNVYDRGPNGVLCEDNLSAQRQHLLTSSFLDDASAGLDANRPSDALWCLSLVGRSGGPHMRAVAEDFTRLGEQYAKTLSAHSNRTQALRTMQEQQLATLLARDDTEGPAASFSALTRRIVFTQQQELEGVLSSCAAAQAALAAELRGCFGDTLAASAPDAAASLLPRDRNDAGPGRAASQGRPAPQFKANVDISQFVPAGVVRTVCMPNPSFTAQAAPGHKAVDTSARTIVLDVSPVSTLPACLSSCSPPTGGGTAAAEEHLMRLAHGKHSMLLLVGPASAAVNLLNAFKFPELLMNAVTGELCESSFSPLPGAPQLKVLFSSRFYGANIVLVWDNSSVNNIADYDAAVMETVVRLSFAWGVDMLSVALLDDISRGSDASPFPAASLSRAPSPSSAAADYSTSFSASVSVIRAVGGAVARILSEATPQAQASRTTSVIDVVLGLGFTEHSLSTPGPMACPVAVGTSAVSSTHYRRVASLSPTAPGEDPTIHPSREPSMLRLLTVRRAASMPVAAPRSPAPRPPPSAAAAPAPALFFNTPLAIRVFLPLPDSFFGAATGAVHHQMSDRAQGGGVGTQGIPAPAQRSPSMSRRLRRLLFSSARVASTTRATSQASSPAAAHVAQSIPTPTRRSGGHYDGLGDSFVTDPRQARQRSECPVQPTLETLVSNAFGSQARVY